MMPVDGQPSPLAVAGVPAAAGPLSLALTLSAPSSGSTLFAMLLARHSQLSSDGETFPQCESRPVTCSCGRLQLECSYYRGAAGHMLRPDGQAWDPVLFTTHPVYSRWALVDRLAGRLWSSTLLHHAQALVRSHLVPAWRRQDAAFVDAHFRFMENSLRLRGARLYVDGCKSIRRASLFAGSGRFRMRVLHLVRDGRGFCFSYVKNRRLPHTELPQAMHAWLREVKAVERFLARWPQLPVLTVRYEDLCDDLTGTLRRVCAFLEVPYDTALESSDPPSCHVLGNSMRLSFSGKVEHCRRWERELAPVAVADLTRQLGSTLERYHYPV